MPLLDSNLESAWNKQYFPYPYLAPYKEQHFGTGFPGVHNLITALETVGLAPGQRVVIVGAGFGWSLKAWLDRGYGPIANETNAGRLLGVDTSTWIQDPTRKAANAEPGVRVDPSDINASTGRKAIRDAFNMTGPTSKVQWIVTEDILPLLTGVGDTPVGAGANEIQPFCDNCRSLATNVAHWITPGYGPGGIGSTSQIVEMNWKSLAAWKAWVTPDFVVQRGYNTVA
jgi:hypothetical protein